MNNKAKITIIGAGNVGATSAYTLALSELAPEIILIDKNADKAHGNAVDIMHGSKFLAGGASVIAGDYHDMPGTSIVIITAGANQAPGETRTDLLACNTAIFKEIISNIKPYITRETILLIVTNPVDILTYITHTLAGLPKTRVIGSGTTLDTARLKQIISSDTGIDPGSINAYVIGEHGDTAVTIWSRTSIAGMPFEEYCRFCSSCNSNIKDVVSAQVRNAAYEVIEQKGATYYAIALAVRRIVECILRDEKGILTVSSVLEGEYGINDMALSLPAVIGRNGIERILPIDYSEEETDALKFGAESLKKVIVE